MTTLNQQKAAELRKPFPEHTVGKLPKSTCRACSQSPRKRCDQHSWVSNCPECKGSHSSATLHLDYVGHAAVTDRLLAVDPEWTWEPVALGPDGLPAVDRAGNLWIRLTVCGVTRLGVGDGKNAKECIGDAIRNAAMRFGVALDLWGKDELEQVTTGAQRLRAALAGAPAPQGLAAALDAAPETPAAAPAPQGAAGADGEEAPPSPASSPSSNSATGPLPVRGDGAGPSDPSGETDASDSPRDAGPVAEPPATVGKPATKPQTRMLFASLKGLGVESDVDRHRVAAAILGRPVASYADLTRDEVQTLIDALTVCRSSEDLFARVDRAEQAAFPLDEGGAS